MHFIISYISSNVSFNPNALIAFLYLSILLEPKRIIIIEWLFALHDKLKQVTDMNIYVETSVNGRLIRRILRDVERTKQKVSEIVDIFINTVDPMHEIHIEPQKENADIIIMNEFIPHIETNDIDLDAFIVQNNIPHLS